MKHVLDRINARTATHARRPLLATASALCVVAAALVGVPAAGSPADPTPSDITTVAGDVLAAAATPDAGSTTKTKKRSVTRSRTKSSTSKTKTSRSKTKTKTSRSKTSKTKTTKTGTTKTRTSKTSKTTGSPTTKTTKTKTSRTRTTKTSRSTTKKSTTATPTSKNAMTFEGGSTDGWQSRSVLVPIRVVEGTGHTGSMGLEISDLSLAKGDDAGLGPIADVGSRFSGTGDWYHISLWVTSPNQPLTGVVKDGKHQPEYGAINVTLKSGSTSASEAIEITQDWQQVDLWFKPGSSSSMSLSLSMREGLIGSIVWLDDVTFERATSHT